MIFGQTHDIMSKVGTKVIKRSLTFCLSFCIHIIWTQLHNNPWVVAHLTSTDLGSGHVGVVQGH